jgi:hypothetical protein
VANDQQQSGNEPHQQSPQIPPAMPKHGATRRRLAKAGLGAAGVLWTLESHASLRQAGFVCMSASSFHSAGLNSNAVTELGCNPDSPSTWKEPSKQWPVSKETPFRDVFTCSGRFADTYQQATLLAVMSADYDAQRAHIGAHLITAYLNVKSGKINFIDEATLRRMWVEINNGGTFKVNPGVVWTELEVRNYLALVHGE